MIYRWWRFAWAPRDQYNLDIMCSNDGWYKRIIGNVWWFKKARRNI